ncbi:uncharacterized protein LOC118197199, partial [Stegodyphus dumicola]|uniref:uncharacterized protein LOC118197199 n=1 Tax=Stegodyphus dumicola TaxID=202533 RepID=UPI0015AF4514
MSFSAALLFYGLSAALIVDSTFLCPYSVTCSCDSPKRNFTFCAATLTDEEHFCQTYSVCEKCKAHLTHCEICRNKFDCINEENAEKRLLRTKRQYSVTNARQRYPGYPCPELGSPKLGSIRCNQERNIRTCRGTCLPGYRFENGERDDIVLTCQRGRWRPLSSFPACE